MELPAKVVLKKAHVHIIKFLFTYLGYNYFKLTTCDITNI
jgi:hypothetical protein